MVLISNIISAYEHKFCNLSDLDSNPDAATDNSVRYSTLPRLNILISKMGLTFMQNHWVVIRSCYKFSTNTVNN